MRVKLLEEWYTVVWVDTCERSSEETVDRIEKLVGRSIVFKQCDIVDTVSLTQIMEWYEIDCVIHFAAYKAVGESCEKPYIYLKNNISGTISLLWAMKQVWVNTLVFSSSATVYDGSYDAPYNEQSPIGSLSNPYWASKYQIELLLDVYCQHSDLSALSLRYFNPVWAHPSGKIWEDVRYSNQSLMAFLMKTMKNGDQMNVFGDDRPTPDGTCLRDYITVNDLIDWHSKALEYLMNLKGKQCMNEKVNLWTGNWVSVLEMIAIVKEATGMDLPYSIGERRAWDLWIVYADVSKAKKVLWWEAKESLVDAVRAEWEFVKGLG